LLRYIRSSLGDALQMSAYGAKADMTFRGNPLSLSLFGVKRTRTGRQNQLDRSRL